MIGPRTVVTGLFARTGNAATRKEVNICPSLVCLFFFFCKTSVSLANLEYLFALLVDNYSYVLQVDWQ